MLSFRMVFIPGLKAKGYPDFFYKKKLTKVSKNGIPHEGLEPSASRLEVSRSIQLS